MILPWVIFALLTGVAVFAVLWPLSRAPATTDANELDVAFYEAQAAEIARDEKRGIIGAGEAEIARNEAARRLIAARARTTADLGSGSRWRPRLVALGTLVFVPALALTLYIQIGAPGMPDAPLEARLDNTDPNKMDMATVVAKIERAVVKNPNDGRGWTLLAMLYARMGRPDDAATAYRNEIRTVGPSADRYAALGEVETYAANGTVTGEAKKDFEQALALDAKSPRAAYYLGVQAEQVGEKAKAVDIWKKLEAESPAGAPWLPTVRTRIAAANGEAAAVAQAGAVSPNQAGAVSPNEPGAVSPNDKSKAQSAAMAQVAALPKDQQQAMIHRMVDGLAARLKGNGNDIDGWLRLVRAYRVLDEQDKAKASLADARRTFAADSGARKRLDELAHELGLES